MNQLAGSPARLPVTVVLLFAGTSILLLGAPLLAVVALAASPLCGRLRPVRVLWLACWYVVHDCAVVLACGGLWIRHGLGSGLDGEASVESHYRLTRWFLERLHDEAVRVLGVEVSYEDSDDAETLLAGRSEPVVLLARHGGVADSFLLAHQLLTRFGRRPRIVMHCRLQLDPAIGILGRRLPVVFVPPAGGRDDVTDEVRRLASSMSGDDALLIFPEGANYTRRRRQRRVASVWRRDRRRGRRVEMLRNLMPVKPQGTLAALEGRPSAPVVFLGHHGLGNVESVVDVLRRLPVGERAAIRMWSTLPSERPESGTPLTCWLDERWIEVDRWIDRARTSVSPPSS